MVEEYIDTFRQRDRLLAAGLNGPGHLLLYGPPGCGKTQAAKYIAAQLSLPLLTARLDGLISSFLGSTAKNIRAFFEFADRTPCILFLDEFDAIAKMRDDEHELGELKRVVNSLLQNIDSLPPGCSVIAATNHEHLLDSAVWRRFEYHVSISLPLQEARLRLLQLYGPPALPQNVLQVLSVMTDGLSASDIQGLATHLARQGVMNKSDASLRGAVSGLLNYRKRFSSDGRTTPWAQDMNTVIRECRRLNPRVFTYDVIAEAFGLGRTKISQAIREPA